MPLLSINEPPARLSPDNQTAGTGTLALTVTGSGYTPASIIYVGGIAQTTTFQSSTTLIAPTAPRKRTPGMSSVTVVTPGVINPISAASSIWTFK